MLKKTYFSILLVFTLMIAVIGGIAQIISMKSDDSPLDMKIKDINGAVYSTEDMPIDVIFQNNGSETIKLLDIFDDPKATKIFFSIKLTDANETPITMLGGGKISLSKDSLKYIELKKDEKYTARINLKDFLPSNHSLKAGVYSVSIIYRNQYGENCFQGNLESNSVSLSLNR